MSGKFIQPVAPAVVIVDLFLQHFKTRVNYGPRVTKTVRMFSKLGQKEKNHLCSVALRQATL